MSSATHQPASVGDQPPRRRLHTAIWARRSTLVWAVVITFVLVMAWPMLKGNYYKFRGIAPPADGIPWRTDYAAALAEAKRTGKPALLDFTADWCPPCRVMKHEVWPDAEVRRAIVQNYVPVLLDVDQPGTAQAAARYQVTTIPSIFIVDGDGNVIRSGSFMSKDEMLKFLSSNPR